MQKGNTYTLVFTAIICVACSILLASSAVLLKEKQDTQSELDRKRNVLKAFDIATVDEQGNKLGEEEINRYFTEHISEVFIDPKTGQLIEDAQNQEADDRLPLYVWKDSDEVSKYAFPVSGKGLWSTIYGYMALDKDAQTIVGLTFYRDGETPGLGGEVGKDWFQDQFKDKKVFKDGSLQRLEVVKGKVTDKYPAGNDHAVDGISGATLTGDGLNHFLNADLEKYEKYFKGIRRG
ncbi:MAG TPA: NADH:ubiquinone reductase (Na(+)-transporting) subunit C [Verrucomicrobia bacterium]|nr:MAG: NADH:ubiquinone reductase (Na(+)-transporting) subunit C [Lentisphaerae bacterium GWF2_57_35]HBA84356.1 NADH:ubiquinone reductase (Na(+)-transporting) subunit C [Verrucomicrobiota bacterium]